MPLTVITVADLGRVSRELDEVENFSLQSSVRSAGKQPALPRVSRGLEELAASSDLNLLLEDDRQKLRKTIDELKKQAPVMHISFASDPSPSFLTKLMTWLRNEVDPNLLISVGLQPGIAAGCIVRTRNKYFDFSLRKNLTQNAKMLTEIITKTESA